MRISALSSDVCSSDLRLVFEIAVAARRHARKGIAGSSDAAGDFLHRPMHIAGIVGVTGAGLHETAKILGLHAFRSEERRGGTEWVSTGRTRWSAYVDKQKNHN